MFLQKQQLTEAPGSTFFAGKTIRSQIIHEQTHYTIIKKRRDEPDAFLIKYWSDLIIQDLALPMGHSTPGIQQLRTSWMTILT